VQQQSSIQTIIETYRTWVEALVGHMTSAVSLLENLCAEQDEMIERLREVFARRHCLRHRDFDAIFSKVLARRARTRQSLPLVVAQYRAGREAVVQETRKLFESDPAALAATWPSLKQRLLDEDSDGAAEVVAVLRGVHMEQEELSAALSALLKRAEKLKVKDLKAIADKLAGGTSRDTVELGAVLAMCESAARDARLKWQRLAG